MGDKGSAGLDDRLALMEWSISHCCGPLYIVSYDYMYFKTTDYSDYLREHGEHLEPEYKERLERLAPHIDTLRSALLDKCQAKEIYLCRYSGALLQQMVYDLEVPTFSAFFRNRGNERRQKFKQGVANRLESRGPEVHWKRITRPLEFRRILLTDDLLFLQSFPLQKHSKEEPIDVKSGYGEQGNRVRHLLTQSIEEDKGP